MGKSPLRVTRLGISNVRGLSTTRFEPSPHVTVLSGANGQGKTSLLEAVYVACRGQSFRTSSMAEVVRHGETRAELRAEIDEAGLLRSQRVVLEPSKRRLELEGKRARSMADYAVQTPVVVFHPGELALTTGGAALRRALLDRVSFFRVPSHLKKLTDYTKAQRERQRALQERGPGALDLPEWEALMADAGLDVMRVRSESAEQLDRETLQAFEALAAPNLRLTSRYATTAPLDVEAYRHTLAKSRVRDAHRGSASTGPHRDDWELRIDDNPARAFASQGQHRALVLAIKSAEIEVVAKARGVQPIVLLDDVSSELDRERTRALFAFLRKQRGQVLLTTTRPELVELGAEADASSAHFELEAGVLVQLR